MVKLKDGVNKVALVEVCGNRGIEAKIISNESGDYLALSGEIIGYSFSLNNGNVSVYSKGKENSVSDIESLIMLKKKEISELEKLVDLARYIEKRI